MRSRMLRVIFAAIFGCAASALLREGLAQAADWPMYGRDATRNSVSPERNPPPCLTDSPPPIL